VDQGKGACYRNTGGPGPGLALGCWIFHAVRHGRAAHPCIMKMGTGTGGDCPDQGLSPFCAGASPHFLNSWWCVSGVCLQGQFSLGLTPRPETVRVDVKRLTIFLIVNFHISPALSMMQARQ